MPSKREIRKHLPEAYWKAAGWIDDRLNVEYGSKDTNKLLSAGLVAAIEEVLMRLQEKAERLARSRGRNDRP